MRYPNVVEKRAYGMDDEGTQYVAIAAIQRWVNSVERFTFKLDTVGAPSFSTGIGHDRLKKIKGLEIIGRLAPLDSCSAVTGTPPTASEILAAMISAAPHNALERERASYRLRMSDGLLRRVQEDVLNAGNGIAMREAWIMRMLPFWQKQAAMAESWLRGNITDLTFYPVYARLKPQS